MIDIKKVLTEHQVDFVTFGPNTKKGEISIKCPLCGDDPSHHLGINPSNGYWACWRDKSHKGKNIAKLLALLDIFVPEERGNILAKLANGTFFNEEIELEQTIREHKKVTQIPTEFVKLDNSVLSRPYIEYLRQRGFNNPTAVADRYDLRRSIESGNWWNRIILPVWMEDEVCWTGRDIGDSNLRYLSPILGETINIKDCLLNYNELIAGGKTLVITEGPFDAIKIDYYLQPNIRATCLFGLGFKEEQLKKLKLLCRNFNNILIGLDHGTISQGLVLAKYLKDFSPSLINIPAKDFGDMNQSDIKITIDKYLEN